VRRCLPPASSLNKDPRRLQYLESDLADYGCHAELGTLVRARKHAVIARYWLDVTMPAGASGVLWVFLTVAACKVLLVTDLCAWLGRQDPLTLAHAD
jgi:hypothetical protein